MLLSAGYEVKEELFNNDSTIIYRGIRTKDNENVIIKTLNKNFPSAREVARVKREHELANFLQEIEGVRKVYQLVENNHAIMLVSQDIGGRTLKKIFIENTESIDDINLIERLQVAIKVANAIGHIHQHGVIHKDISPDNIIFNPSREQVQIIDFGISSLSSIELHSFQNHNELEGKLEYISPEQTGRINRALDYRSDLYSFGVTLYQLFTGELPFKDCHGLELVHAHIAKTPTSPNEINANIPVSLANIITRLLSKVADDRYQTAKGLAHDLELCLQQMQKKSPANFTLASLDQSPQLQFKQKLYGRGKEVSSLIDSFERVSQGAAEIVLVSGLSGTGKSALVNEVHRPLTEKQGIFISGKFEQNNKNTPFSALNQAFTALAKYLLKEDETRLSYWRHLINEALGNNGQVLIDAVPSFELIIGKQAKSSVLTGIQAQHRFSYVINQFVYAIAQQNHPLVIFIDDWQWADNASLALLQSLLAGKAKQHLMLIAAYRDNEVTHSHPFSLVIEKIAHSAIPYQVIHLENLTRDATQALICDALQQSTQVHDLSALVYEKTQGNAFFLIQFLEMLEKQKLLRFDIQKNQWFWDIAELSELNITNNVIELMVDKIKQLPQLSQQALKYAACIANQFQLTELSHILDYPLEPTSELINIPVKEGILRHNQGSYYFIHDRVQQAAYSIFNSQNKKQVHYKIAQALLQKLSSEEQNNQLFEIVRHLNLGSDLITDNSERQVLANLNFQAGHRAKQVTAFDAALTHFKIAINALTANCWDSSYLQQTLDLYLEAAEVAYFLSLFEQMETWLTIVQSKAESPIDKARVDIIKVQAYTAQNKLSDAVDSSLRALKVLGINIPKKPTDFQVLINLLKTKNTLRGHTPQALLSLPKMEDKQQLIIMELLGLTVPAAYWTSSNLVAMIIFKMTQNSVTQGYAPISGYAFSWWGITECAMLGNIDKGYDFGALGIQLAETHQLQLHQPVFFSGWMINNYKHPLKESLPILDRAYSLSLEKGDFEYASYALNNSIQHRLHSGELLTTLQPDMEKAHQTLKNFNMASSQFWHDICWQLSMNMSTLDSAPLLLAGEAYNEEKYLSQHLKENDASTLFFLYFAKLMQSYIFNDIVQAQENVQKIQPYLKAGVGTYQHRLFNFYHSLTLLAEESDSIISRWKNKRLVISNQQKLKQWSTLSPRNHLHHWHLVQAELMRVNNKPNKAMGHYNKAIKHANEQGFIHEEALAYELFTRFHIQTNQKRFACHDLIQSHYLYIQWGAHGKAKQLQQHYACSFPQILTYVENGQHHALSTQNLFSQRTQLTNSSTLNLSSQLDLETMIKSSQLIAGEIVFDKLIQTLSNLIIENAGAQRFLLLKPADDDTLIEFESTLDNDKISSNLTLQGDISQGVLDFPKSLINYVQRTLQTIVLDDALKDKNFAQDAYFKMHKIHSVFCSPMLHQGQLTGIIYLENRLIPGVFTPDRLELIQLLSAQAAISIENARLYSNLENKVLERTQQLEAANEQLTLLATTDNLTKLSNRRQFNEQIKLAFSQAQRLQHPISLLLCDVDNFKKYNDTYGHVDGDECLRKIGKVFKEVFNRSSDLSARYGGEEFAVILPATDVNTAIIMAQKLCTSIQSLNIPHQVNESFNQVTISVGCYALVPNREQSIDSQIEKLLRQTDKALYHAKENGRNCAAQLPEEILNTQ